MADTRPRRRTTRGFASLALLAVTTAATTAVPLLAATIMAPSAGGDAGFLAANQAEGAALGGAGAVGFVIGVLVIAALVLLILILADEI